MNDEQERDEQERKEIRRRITKAECRLNDLRQHEEQSLENIPLRGFKRASDRETLVSQIREVEEALRMDRMRLAEFGGHAGHRSS